MVNSQVRVKFPVSILSRYRKIPIDNFVIIEALLSALEIQPVPFINTPAFELCQLLKLNPPKILYKNICVLLSKTVPQNMILTC